MDIYLLLVELFCCVAVVSSVWKCCFVIINSVLLNFLCVFVSYSRMLAAVVSDFSIHAQIGRCCVDTVIPWQL